MPLIGSVMVFWPPTTTGLPGTRVQTGALTFALCWAQVVTPTTCSLYSGAVPPPSRAVTLKVWVFGMMLFLGLQSLSIVAAVKSPRVGGVVATVQVTTCTQVLLRPQISVAV